MARILITRPLRRAHKFSQALITRGVRKGDIIHAPVIEIQPTPGAPDVRSFDGIICSSLYGVPNQGHGLPFYCVGQSTAQAATQAGFHVRHVSATVAELKTVLENANLPNLLYLRGAYVTDRLENLATSHVAYVQIPCPVSAQILDRIAEGGPVIAPLFSARSARLLFSQLRAGTNLRPVVISHTVAQIAADAGYVGETAPHPTVDAMQIAVFRLWSDTGS